MGVFRNEFTLPPSPNSPSLEGAEIKNMASPSGAWIRAIRGWHSRRIRSSGYRADLPLLAPMYPPYDELNLKISPVSRGLVVEP
jgi:hypothetical protein